ncbi:neutral zinc metallopeptidase [Mycolicibacterium monacense]|uniref:neutral zinc metallopeptidase n=1 Tax=Mycolicibacterium monacense TaxID=85693 RepID=UPI0007EAB35C|nr:neutral zinc metallopeptidase [Mycolicibacterium monacense]OBF48898.1 peptidase [Mycolicibacterium monacense]
MVSVAILSGCSSGPTAPAQTEDPSGAFLAGGVAVTDGPSGVRANTPPPARTALYATSGSADRLALLGVDDVEQFWSTTYSRTFDSSFQPVGTLVSYDSEDRYGPEVCGSDQYDNENAMYCFLDDTMAWDRGFLVPTGQQYFGDVSIAALIAHEYGHAVQHESGLTSLLTDTIVKEQQADCFAGAYSRWVAESHSPRFELSTGDGLNRILAAVITLRDDVLTPDQEGAIEGGHGTALDRIGAFQMGFTDGTTKCTTIDSDEIEQRRGDLPLVLGTDSAGDVQSGEMPVDQNTLVTLMELLDQVYQPQSPPGLSMTPEECPDTTPTPSAAYCPATNTVSVDLPTLQEMSIPADRDEYVLPQGDNTALSLVTSRYALGLQHARGLPLDAPATALRTACLTGVAQRAMADELTLPSGQTLMLSAGDMDEAVGGLLTNGIVASTLDGSTVPAGFTRIEAFRNGLYSTQEQCFTRY